MFDCNQWLVDTYHELNKRHFANRLPLVELFYHDDREPLGKCWYPSGNVRDYHISLTRHFLIQEYRYPLVTLPRLATDILLHEMLHLHLIQTLDRVHICDCHGTDWITACIKIAPSIGLDCAFDSVSKNAFTYFPHTFTQAAFYRHETNVRRSTKNRTTLYEHT